MRYEVPGGIDGAVVRQRARDAGAAHRPAAGRRPRTSAPYFSTLLVGPNAAGGAARCDAGKVVFVGAGPGAADLLTLRAVAAIGAADMLIWASSLVSEEVLQHARPDARDRRFRSSPTRNGRRALRRGCANGCTIARIHSGDPALWGAMQEQLDRAVSLGLEVEVIPGVSSFSAAAAAIGRELTIPEVAQSVDPHPARGRQDAHAAARGGARVRSARDDDGAVPVRGALQAAAGGAAGRRLRPETPCVVAYRVTWEDELIVRCRSRELTATVREHKLWKHTLVLVGPALAAGGTRSHLYHPGHFHGFRRAEPEARRQLRAEGTDERTGRACGASRAGSAAHHEGAGQGLAHRLDHGDVQRCCREGRQHRAFQRRVPSSVDTPLPGGGRTTLAVDSGEVGSGRATAVVIKDAGDDPDVTHGAPDDRDGRLARDAGHRAGRRGGRRRRDQARARARGRRAGHQPGAPGADHPGRRRGVDLTTQGVRVVISVPDGERMARKTTNGRLGILGGISILGTTGIVRPFSTASWRASVDAGRRRPCRARRAHRRAGHWRPYRKGRHDAVSGAGRELLHRGRRLHRRRPTPCAEPVVCSGSSSSAWSAS